MTRLLWQSKRGEKLEVQRTELSQRKGSGAVGFLLLEAEAVNAELHPPGSVCVSQIDQNTLRLLRLSATSFMQIVAFFSNKLPLIWINKKICFSITVWWLSLAPWWIHKSVSCSSLQIILMRNKARQYKLSFLHDFSGPGVCTLICHILMPPSLRCRCGSWSWVSFRFVFLLLLFRAWILVGERL